MVARAHTPPSKRCFSGLRRCVWASSLPPNAPKRPPTAHGSDGQEMGILSRPTSTPRRTSFRHGPAADPSRSASLAVASSAHTHSPQRPCLHAPRSLRAAPLLPWLPLAFENLTPAHQCLYQSRPRADRYASPLVSGRVALRASHFSQGLSRPLATPSRSTRRAHEARRRANLQIRSKPRRRRRPSSPRQRLGLQLPARAILRQRDVESHVGLAARRRVNR
jgi:hypothetical protein